jgi:hypothetical protein
MTEDSSHHSSEGDQDHDRRIGDDLAVLAHEALPVTPGDPPDASAES